MQRPPSEPVFKSLHGIRFVRQYPLALGSEFRDAPGPRPQLDMNRTWEPAEPLAARLLILALGTLLRNAAEHAEAARVTVTLDEEALVVRDDGRGIADLAPLQKAIGKLHPPPGGGLGLSLVQRICLRMEWRFSIQNRTEEAADGFEARVQLRTKS